MPTLQIDRLLNIKHQIQNTLFKFTSKIKK